MSTDATGTAPNQTPTQRMQNCFTRHPASVNETYAEHARCAAHFAKELALASMAAAVHAVFPALCTTTASTKVKALCAEMTSGNRAEPVAGSAAEPLAGTAAEPRFTVAS